MSMKAQKTITPALPPAAKSSRRVRSVTLTVRYADEPPTLAEVVQDIKQAANRLAE